MKTMTELPLFIALLALLEFRIANRREREIQPGSVVGEEKGHTFGKVVGIEEAIAEHALYVKATRVARDRLFSSQIYDDRVSAKASSEVRVGSIVVLQSDEYGRETYEITPIAGNESPISPNSPLGQVVLRQRKGSSFSHIETTYSVVEVVHPSNPNLIRQRFTAFVKESIKAAEEVISSGSGAMPDDRRIRVEIANVLDRFELIEILSELYGITEIPSTLARLKRHLQLEPRVPAETIRQSGDFGYVLTQLNQNA